MLGNLQRIACAKWTRTLGFFEYNPVNGYIEMRWLAPNTLVLTNSKALYSIIQPENPEQRFNRQTFQFPSEESFKFFSNGDKKISSSYYETAKNLFDSEPFFGFYPPKSKTLSTPIKCKSDVKEFETLLRDLTALDPIVMLLVNTQPVEPVEQHFLFMPNTNALWEDMARLNALYEELMWPVTDKLTMRIEGDHIVIKNFAQEQREHNI